MGGENDRAKQQANRPPGGEHAGTVQPATDVLFDVLGDQTRRRLLWYLLDESSASVDELTDVLVGWELAGSWVVDTDRRGRIAASLHHVHLPKLVAAGLVDYDRDAGTVSLASLAPSVAEMVRFAYEYGKAASSGQDQPSDEG